MQLMLIFTLHRKVFQQQAYGHDFLTGTTQFPHIMLAAVVEVKYS